MTDKHAFYLPISKIMLTFLLVIGVLTFLSLQPAAAQIEKEGDLSFQLTYDGTSYTVVGCEKTAAGDLMIPATYKDLPVTGIGASAFWECANLTGITVPEGITVINPNTFYGCTGLKSIILPDSVTVIGRNAFSGCTGLTSVTLSKSLTLIEGTAFQACSNLKSITIPEGVTEIGERVFEDCTNLTNISIPSSVTVLAGAFLDCPNLAYTVYDNGKYLGNANNPYLVLMESTAKDITQCNIHTDTRFIYFWAFADCTRLTQITIPDKVTHIGTGVFADCVGLTDVTIGKETRNIESSAFSGCTSLNGIWVPEENPNFTSSLGILFTKEKTMLIKAPATLSGTYTVPESVTCINHSAFYGCDNLTGVTIGKDVTTIGSHAFGNCDRLASISVAEDNLNYKTDSAGVLFNKKETLLIQMPGAYRGAYTVPDSVTMLDQYSLLGCAGLESLTIPKSIQNLGYKAFDGCTNLKTIHYLGAQARWEQLITKDFNEPPENVQVTFAIPQETTPSTQPTTEPTSMPTAAPTAIPTTAPITQPTTAATTPVDNEQDKGVSTGVIVGIAAVIAIGTAVFVIFKKKKA